MKNDGDGIRRKLSRWGLPVACLALAMGYVELRREKPGPSAVPAAAASEHADARGAERINALERQVQLLRAARTERAEQGGATTGAGLETAAEGDTEMDEELTPAERQRAREEQIAADRAARRQFLDEL